MTTKLSHQELRYSLTGYLIAGLCAVMFTLSASVYAQGGQAKAETKIVSGRVIDEKGQAMPGVTVFEVGNPRVGTATDLDGKFSLKVSTKSSLELSFIGYQTKRVAVTAIGGGTITLKESTQDIDDVTVVAFAKQKKESVIGSITTVKPGQLKTPSSNLTTALAGQMSGIIAYQRSGEPGKDDADFFIRGATSFGYTASPLILLDNLEVSSSDLSRIQPDDIASFSIMKDATATALYGSRGANGVILVTTKKGVEGKAKIDIRFENSTSTPTQLVKLADPITYMNLHNEAVLTRDPLGVRPYSQNKIAHTLAGDNPMVYPANDWYGSMFNKVANNQRLNFSVSGGGKVASYYVSGSGSIDNGVLKTNSQNNFNNNISLKRYQIRSNIDLQLSPTTKLMVRTNGSFDDYVGPRQGGDQLFEMAMRANPVLFPAFYEPDEEHLLTGHPLFGNYDKGQYTNPYAQMVSGYKESSNSTMSVQLELSQDLRFITEGLNIRGLANINRYSYFDVVRSYNPFYYNVSSYDKFSDTYKLNGINDDSGTEYLTYTPGDKRVNAAIYAEAAISYNKTYNDKHGVSGLLVSTIRSSLDANAGTLQKSLPYRNISLAGRFTYAFDSRYFLEGNFGYNGSERFARKNRFGFFPSAGLGYVISNEAFWGEGISKIIPKFKLKATYGLVGNDAIGDANDRFFYLGEVNLEDGVRNYPFGTAQGYPIFSGVSTLRYANDDIGWEIARKTNLGIEMNLFGKLEIQVDCFHEYRSNILMNRASVPSTMGLTAAVRSNVGEASSRGIDGSIDYSQSFTNGMWIQGRLNFTYATTKYEKFEEPVYPNSPWRSYQGHSLDGGLIYIAERLFIDEKDVTNSPTQFGEYGPGDIKYKDLNNDGKITDDDLAWAGYPQKPEIVYGFGFSMGYKWFDLSCFFQGLARESFYIAPYDKFNVMGVAPFVGGQSALIKDFADSHWSEENRDIYATWPRLSEKVVENNSYFSTWYMRDGSFLRLKSLEFGYTLPQRITKKVAMEKLRIYFTGTNLLTFSKFKMWDPEMGGQGLRYPLQKVFNFGVQVSF